MARLLVALVCLFAVAASETADDICTAPDRYAAVILNLKNYRFFKVEMDYANKVSMHTPFNNTKNEYSIHDYKNGVTKNIGPNGCVVVQTPVLKSLSMKVTSSATKMSTVTLDGLEVTGYRQTVEGISEETYIDEKTCLPKIIRIHKNEETYLAEVFFNLEIKTGKLDLTSVPKCEQ